MVFSKFEIIRFYDSHEGVSHSHWIPGVVDVAVGEDTHYQRTFKRCRFTIRMTCLQLRTTMCARVKCAHIYMCWMFLGPAIWIDGFCKFGYISVILVSTIELLGPGQHWQQQQQRWKKQQHCRFQTPLFQERSATKLKFKPRLKM